MKYYSLALMAASIGAAVGYAAQKDYPLATYCVISCAINHFCYRYWKKTNPATNKMKIYKIVKVSTGEIYVVDGQLGQLEFLTVGDYGKNANIKVDFLGITRELNDVPNGEPKPLTEKWVITISTQYGYSII